MHQDIFSTNTWLAQLRGEKTWRLCPPDGLDPAVGENVDAFSGDGLGCDLYETVLVAGDVIYLPPDWWHQVRNPTTASLALSGNFCTFEAARAHLSAVATSDASDARKKTYMDMWQAVLATEVTPPTRWPGS
jgi:ribosomal protein L16 Arg81 hydroxylase